MYFIVKVFIVFFVGWILKRAYTRHKMSYLVNLMPGPPTLPILGNLLTIMGDPEFFWSIVRKCNAEYGPTFRIWTPHWIVTNIRDPDDIEIVFTDIKMIDKSRVYDSIKPWLREGLLTSTGKKWQSRRKILTHAFHFNILQKYMEVILEISARMVTELQSEGGAPVRNLEPWVSDHTLDIICETAMGISLRNMSKQVYARYKQAVHLMGFVVIHRIIRPWLIPDILFMFTPTAWKQRKAIKVLHEFSTRIINERKKYHEQTAGKYLSNFDNDNEVISSTKKRLAMLDLLIAAYRDGQIDDVGMREEVDTFIFEGYDTTAMAMCYSILLLAEHADVQARARDEVEKVWEACDGKLTMADVQKFTYLERCIKETLRLFPSVPLISRQTRNDIKLKNYVIPANIVMNIHIYDTHRDPKYWPNPTVFDPDRFLPENIKDRHPYSYIPFSGGFRNCIGQKFAMLELKTFIAHILHNFTIVPIETSKDIKPYGDLVLRSSVPLRVKFVPIPEVTITKL